MVNMVKKNKLITAANFRDFDWNKAKLFYHLAKCGGFTKAARLAGIDQSVLTRQIQTLEIQVGSRLVTRVPSGIVLTRKGEELLEKIAPFFLEMRGFCGNAHVEIKGEKKRKIRIATTHAFASYIIGDLILDYAAKNPHISFELIADDYLTDIIVSDVDVAIQPLDTRLTGKKIKGIHYDHLFSIEKKLYASSEYIRIYGEPQTTTELVKHHIISFPQSEAFLEVNWILVLGMPEGESHNPVYTSNSIESLVHAAERGVGIIGSYEHYTIIKNSQLINILPHVKNKELKEYFIYPDYLKDDKIIMDIKNFLIKKLNL